MPLNEPIAALVLTAPTLVEDHVATVNALLPASDAATQDVLGPGQACEWHLSGIIEDQQALLTRLRSELASEPVDVNIVGLDVHRRKRLLIADMDSTIIQQECIDEIADLAGCGTEVAAITERAMRGELDFEEALRVRIGLLEGLETSALERVIDERLTLTPGAKPLVGTMAANKAFCALVSGGFTFFTSRIADMVGFHENRANTLEISNNRLTGRPVPPILGRQAKLDALNDFCRTRAIPLAATLAVGDGANDLAMIKAAGLGAAFHAKPLVAAEADVQINHSDLTALLYLQGYHQSEFIC